MKLINILRENSGKPQKLWEDISNQASEIFLWVKLKILKREIEEDIRRGKVLASSWIDRISSMKIVILLKVNDKFKAFSHQNSNIDFHINEKNSTSYGNKQATSPRGTTTLNNEGSM